MKKQLEFLTTEYADVFDVMESERYDEKAFAVDSNNDIVVADKTYIYKMENPPPQLGDLNDYFVKYKTENDSGYIDQFLHYYEGVLNNKAWKFIMNFHLEQHRREDLKQIFCVVMWENLETFKPDDKIVFLQQIKYLVYDKWHDYVRTCCSAAYVDKVGTYDNVRKVARLYYEKEGFIPYDKLVAEIAEELKLTVKTVDEFIKNALSGRYADDIDDEETPEPAAPEPEEEDFTKEEILEALNILDPIDLRILELYAGVDTKKFTNIKPLTYDYIAMMTGYDSESTIEKKLKEIKATVKERLLYIHNRE